MSSAYDPSDFVDSDFQETRGTVHRPASQANELSPMSDLNRPPSREEVETKVGETQQKLAELRRAQDDLERERASLEDLRRRQMEFQTGREEMLNHLTRGLGLLEESEFAARRDAEQMSKTVVDLRSALDNVQFINEQNWTKDDYNLELTRALTALEHARMEWNSARLKYPLLSGQTPEAGSANQPTGTRNLFAEQNMAQLCRLGLAMTWPLVLLGLGIFLLLLLRK